MLHLHELEFDETWIDHNWVLGKKSPAPHAIRCIQGIWQMAYGIWYAEFPLLPRLPLLHAMQGDRPARSELFISRQVDSY